MIAFLKKVTGGLQNECVCSYRYAGIQNPVCRFEAPLSISVCECRRCWLFQGQCHMTAGSSASLWWARQRVVCRSGNAIFAVLIFQDKLKMELAQVLEVEGLWMF